MGFIGTILHNIRNMKRAKAIRAMPREQLLAMEDGDFYDAIVCICEDNVYDLKEQKLLREQVLMYTLHKLLAEVNNGGLCQFFVNSSRDCAPYVSEALAAVGAVEIKDLYDRFVSDNGIDVNDLSSFKITKLEDYEAQTERFDFDAFDDKFYADTTLYRKILAYARENLDKILSE